MVGIYKLLLEIYFHIRPLRLKELLVGTKAWEEYWIKRKRGKDWHGKQTNWIEGYWNSGKHPHRKMLIDAICKYKPKSVLEVGCACGVNLRLLAERLPDAQLYGIDINKEAIEYGQQKFKELGIDNVWLCHGKADELLFAENSIDVVFTDACLIYVGKDKIRAIMNRINSIAKVAIVLLERHQNEHLSIFKDATWQHNYSVLIPHAVMFTKITPDIWKEWSESGYLIEAKL